MEGATAPPPGWLAPAPARPLEPDERFSGLDARVVDFWRWAFSDLRSNTVRGVLAEFLVASALGCADAPRNAWANFDLITADRLRVEVKASGYLQSWPQARLSQVSFGRVAARAWDATRAAYSASAEVRADLFVFAVQTCRDHQAYDVLDVAQWEFYVVPAQAVRDCGWRRIGLGWVRRQASPVPLSGLADRVRAVAEEHGIGVAQRSRS